MNSTYSRRDFLIGGGTCALSLLTPTLLPQISKSALARPIAQHRNVLVVVFLRGGFDGLSLICPIQGPDRHAYDSARPYLGIPSSGSDAGLSLTDQFMINRAAEPLHALFKKKQLAFIHACGLTQPSRSHFAAQSLLDLGNSKPGEFSSGWLTRFLQTSPCRVATIGSLKPASLQGHNNLLLIPRLKGLGLDGSSVQQLQLRTTLRKIYSNAPDTMQQFGLTALNMLESLEDISLSTLAKNLQDSPQGEIEQKFSLAAQLIQHDPQLGIVTLDIGGWDTHRQQGTNGDGYFAKQVSNLSKALQTFIVQLENLNNASVTTLFFSEFGRRLKENASRGTDHGHGNIAWLCGPKVKGGEFYGVWPGLEHNKLFERSDLATTTDLQSIFYEFLRLRESNLKFETIFKQSRDSAKFDFFKKG